MKKNLLAGLCITFAATNAHAGLLGPDNWFECILARMPGVQNDYAAGAVLQSCAHDFGNPQPGPTDRGMFAKYGSGDQCVMDKGKDTASELGARVIVASCHQLYDPSPADLSKLGSQ